MTSHSWCPRDIKSHIFSAVKDVTGMAIYRVAHEVSYLLWRPGRPENVALLRALSEDLCRKVVTNARVHLQEVVRKNGGHIEHVHH